MYGVNGIYHVNAFWKDNATIVIETKRNYPGYTQYKSVRSFDDIITIEYVES